MSTRKIKCKQHTGLKRDGSLKKGYRYVKGGRIVKAKSTTTAKKKQVLNEENADKWKRVAFESLLVAENFIFINRLVVQVGGKKKGGKSQDISEILSIWENDKTRVENAYHTLKITREQRAKNFFAFVAQIPAKWKIIIDFLAQTPHIKEEVQDAIDFIDDLFPIFKK